MLALVILESFREAQTGISKTHIRAVVAATGDAIEAEHRKNSKSRVVDRSGCPGVPRELAAWSVIGIGTKNPDAGRIDSAVVGDDIADDVVGERGHDLVTRGVKPLSEMRGAVQALLLSRVGDKDHRCREPAGKAVREHPGQLDNRGCAGAVIVGARR